MEAPCPRCGQPAEVYDGPPSHKTGTVFCDHCHARIPLPVEEPEPEPQAEPPAEAGDEGPIAEQKDPAETAPVEEPEGGRAPSRRGRQ